MQRTSKFKNGEEKKNPNLVSESSNQPINSSVSLFINAKSYMIVTAVAVEAPSNLSRATSHLKLVMSKRSKKQTKETVRFGRSKGSWRLATIRQPWRSSFGAHAR